MDTGLNSSGGVRRPWIAGFATRLSGDAGGLWREFAEYPDGRVGVVIGSCTDRVDAQRIRVDTSSRLRDGADPAAVLGGFTSARASVLAAVIDRADSRMSYGSLGAATPTLAVPDEPHRVLDGTGGRVASLTIPPGATVVLSTRPVTPAAPADGGWPTSSALVLDQLIAGVPGHTGVVIVVYRHPPAPLSLTVPAEAASLAVIRRELRSWLAMTGADDEVCADVLLAVGEAATNAAEHGHDGSGRSVQINVAAQIAGDALRFTVADNGTWKTPVDSNGHRGHGLRLMKALVDGVDVTTTEDGTTVEMFKDVAE